MGLPKLETPEYKIEVPSTKEIITYRPFLVKEEKLLLTVLETATEDDLEPRMKELVIRIIDICTFKKVDMDKLTDFDIDYIFLNIRSKSRGEMIAPAYACTNVIEDGEQCGESNEISINTDEVKVTFPKEDKSKVMLDDSVGIQFKYISAKTSLMHQKEKDAVKRMFKVIVDSVDYVFDAEEIYKASETPKKELLEFIENLTEKNFMKVKEFFSDQPILKHVAKYKCKKCGYEEDIVFEGVESFFG